MSRIHEALKKAEQERAAGHAGGAPPDAGAFADEPSLATATISTSAATLEMPPLTGASNLEGMLGRCPQMPWTPDPAITLFTNGNDAAKGTEEFRTLRSRLYHLREKMPLKKVLITSALPKEGKSFTSLNLAQVLVRQHGRRVLLIDGDLRGPRLHLMLGTAPGPGLGEYLQGQIDEFSIMQRGPQENLYFIPSGGEITNPAELVGNGRLRLLLQKVEQLFDWIIIDSPPSVPVSDAGLLAKVCDGVLMVVRSNATPVDMARRARMEFPEQSLLGVVLNGARRDGADYQRYYYEAYGTNHQKK